MSVNRAINIGRVSPRFSRGLRALLDPITGQDLLVLQGSPTITGTRIRGSKLGKSRGFNTTEGVGSTDLVRVGSAAQHTGGMSFAVRAIIRGSGGGTFGRLLHKGPIGNTTGSLQCFFSSATYNPGITLQVMDTGGGISVARTWPLPALGTPMTIVFSIPHVGANAADLWINGVLVSTSSTASVTGGVPSNSTDPWLIGNRGDGTRVLDGLIGGVIPIWNRALAPGEAELISSDFDNLYAKEVFPFSVPIGSIGSVTIFYPSSDITTTGWEAVPGPAFYASVDEEAFSDSDYIISPNSAAPETLPQVMGLNAPMPAGTWDIKFRVKKDLADPMAVTVQLKDGSTVVGSSFINLGANLAYEEVTLEITTTGTATSILFLTQNGAV